MTEAVQWTREPGDAEKIAGVIQNVQNASDFGLRWNPKSGIMTIEVGGQELHVRPGQWLIHDSDNQTLRVSNSQPQADSREVISDWLDENDDGGRACAALRAALTASNQTEGDDAYEFGYASAMNDVVEAVRESLDGQ